MLFSLPFLLFFIAENLSKKHKGKCENGRKSARRTAEYSYKCLNIRNEKQISTFMNNISQFFLFVFLSSNM